MEFWTREMWMKCSLIMYWLWRSRSNVAKPDSRKSEQNVLHNAAARAFNLIFTFFSSIDSVSGCIKRRTGVSLTIILSMCLTPSFFFFLFSFSVVKLRVLTKWNKIYIRRWSFRKRRRTNEARTLYYRTKLTNSSFFYVQNETTLLYIPHVYA